LKVLWDYECVDKESKYRESLTGFWQGKGIQEVKRIQAGSWNIDHD
jgi:hypothetical protein